MNIINSEMYNEILRQTIDDFSSLCKWFFCMILVKSEKISLINLIIYAFLVTFGWNIHV